MTGTHARLSFAHLIGESAVFKDAIRRARLAANSNATVLLHGETGTGKELYSQSIHNDSVRSEGPFVAINCAAIPRELITTELFGYEGGAFTGADRQGRPGKFEQAHKGTLFLDEIGDMPLDLQASLLRAIETHSIVRIGGQRVIATDVRIVVATHKDLQAEAQRGNFRSDLYYRLNVLTIEIPPLRQRSEDIPMLVSHFLQRQSRILQRPLTITPDALATIQDYPWPGNVRELENTLERVTHLTANTIIELQDLPVHLFCNAIPQYSQPALDPETRSDADTRLKTHRGLPQPQTSEPAVKRPQSGTALKSAYHQAQTQAIRQAFEQSSRNMTQTAELLGISRTTLWRKMVKYGIDR
jgi:transcriptional regulator with PAS, ATPase and Fis domain